MGRLEGRVCMITGAASGQGRVAVQVFAREGARLVLADKDEEGLTETAASLDGFKGDALVCPIDLTLESGNQEMVRATLGRFTRVDALYNAAGLVKFSSAHETSLEDWRFVMDHELTMTFLACKHVLPAMMEQGSGSIINMSSLSGLFGTPRHAAHAATKAGIAGLTKQIAVDYGPRGIRCNAIAPSFIVYGPGQRRTASQTRAHPPEGIPLGRHCTPEDTANLALFLASDDSSFISGQVIRVDGGRSAAG